MVRGSNRLRSSSRTKTPPAMGALNAVASPAAAPAATRTRRSARLRRVTVATMTAADAPICTDGPSRPNAIPLLMASSPPTYFTGSNRNRSGRTRPSATASTRGIPLPSACGSTRCTSAAATAAAAVQTSTTTIRPHQWPCAQPARIRAQPRTSFEQQPKGCGADSGEHSDGRGRQHETDQAFGALALVVDRVGGGARVPGEQAAKEDAPAVADCCRPPALLIGATWARPPRGLGGPARRPLLQERQHALAGFVGDEQPGRFGAEPLGVTVESVQHGGGGQCLGCRQALR